MEETYMESQRVTVHSLGSTAPGTYRGIVRGISIDMPGPAKIYIIEMWDPIEIGSGYTCVTMPAACLRKDW